MNKRERAKMVIAMETIARSLNDEYYLMSWLENGVADGDIDDETTEDNIDEYYLDDEHFRHLMTEFNYLMYKAYKHDSGLYVDGVRSYKY